MFLKYSVDFFLILIPSIVSINIEFVLQGTSPFAHLWRNLIINLIGN